MYKKQVSELQYSLNEGAIKLDKFELETKKLSENLNTLQIEKYVSIIVVYINYFYLTFICYYFF